MSANEIYEAAAKAALPSPAPAMPKIYVAVCSSDWRIEIHTSESIRAIANACRCECVVRYMMNDGVARSRNNLAAGFLETDCTHLWFLDSDIVIEARQFALLLEAIADGIKVVAGLYPKKQGVLDWVINFLNGERPDEKGRIKLKHAGTGCLLIAREVIEQSIKLHPEIEYAGDPAPDQLRWDLFPMRAVNRLYESEDWAFCNRLIEDGFAIFGHTGVQLRHVGKCVYPLQFTLSDEEVVDILFHRYAVTHESAWAFIASGADPGKQPGLMGGHRERAVRIWPPDYPVADIFEGGIIAGSLDLPISPGRDDKPPRVVDIGAGYGSFLRFAVRRWPGCSVKCFESAADRFEFLQRTCAGVNPEMCKVECEPLGFTKESAAQIPEGEILRIDCVGADELIAGLCAERKSFDQGTPTEIPGYDGIIVRVDGLSATNRIENLLRPGYDLIGLQRLGDGSMVVKFVARRLRPDAQKV